MIELHDVSLGYPDNSNVMEHCNLRIEDGEKLCIMGPSGCGKTTLLRLLSKSLVPQSGEVTGLYEKKISMVFQEDRLIDDFTVRQNIGLGCRRGINSVCEADKLETANQKHPLKQPVKQPLEQPLKRSLKQSQSLKQSLIQWVRQSKKQAKQSIKQEKQAIKQKSCQYEKHQDVICCHLEQVGLLAAKDEKVSDLSGGMKRRVSIVRAILAESDMVIMDEPFNGIDQEKKIAVANYILEHLAQRTLIMVTHDARDCELLGAKMITISDVTNQSMDI